MKIVIIGGEKMKEELLSEGLKEGVELIWTEKASAISGAEAYIHFTPGHQIAGAMQLISSISATNAQLPSGAIRFNGWPGFLKGKRVEVAGENTDAGKKAAAIFSCFNKIVEWVPDIPGMIAPRVVSMIINEAYFALGENVSSKEEIDTAMKLGTNYPFGPFEWGEKIGLKKIYELLSELSETEPRYEPAALLKKQAFAS